MPELPEVEPDKPAWLASVWTPISLFATFAIVTLIINPTGSDPDEAPWGLVAFGLMLSTPLACALFAAWAPQPAVWRIPLSVAACSLLGLTGCVIDGDFSLAAGYAVFFVIAGTVLVLIRRTRGWRLFLCSDDSTAGGRSERPQFSMKYLIAWTAVTAGMLSLAKYISTAKYDGTGRTELVGSSILNAIAFSAIMSIELAPVIAVTGVVLAQGSVSQARIAFVLIGLCAATLLATLALRWIQPPGPGEAFLMTWWFHGQLCFGATLGMLISTGVLRWAGYRLVRNQNA